MRHGANGAILDVGRRTRTIPPALRRALAHRDGGCRFPGCNLSFCDVHHVEHWADGGETKLDNLIQLCRRHHRAVHEEGFTVELGAGASACVPVCSSTTWPGSSTLSTDPPVDDAGDFLRFPAVEVIDPLPAGR